MKKNKKNEYPKLKFRGGLDARQAHEYWQKGNVTALVELSEKQVFEVEFSTLQNLEEGINGNVKYRNDHFEAVPNVIVLTDVTIENINAAVQKLAKGGEYGFFTYLKEWDFEKEERLWKKQDFEGYVIREEYSYPSISESDEILKADLEKWGWKAKKLSSKK